MDYVELDMSVGDDERAEIVTALLCDMPFEAFETADGHLKAYIPAKDYEACRAEAAAVLDAAGVAERSERVIGRENWNAAWESDFEPVEVAGDIPVRIRAPHHAPSAAGVMDVTVVPHMSFGTGHHVTTALMTSAITSLGIGGLRGLDMGCGTGVLSIVAVKCGAEAVTAVDTDEWACLSCRESAELNGVADRIEVVCGSMGDVAARRFDFIVANINRNILLDMMPMFGATLAEGGRCVMSGFLADDAAAIREAAQRHGMACESEYERDGWVAAVCRKAE